MRLPRTLPRVVCRAGLVALALAALAPFTRPQQQQTYVSIDWKSPTVAIPDAQFAVPITEGDLLVPAWGPSFGPLPQPGIAHSAGFAPTPGLGLFMHPPCVGHPPGTPCGVEVDALSYGLDFPYTPLAMPFHRLLFSTDPWVQGLPGMPAPPTIWTEGPIGDLSADVLVDFGLVPGPLPPFAAPMPGSVALLDGDGMLSGSGFLYPGLGLIEPNPPVVALPTPGDELDALEVDPFPPAMWPPLGIFYSLDAPWPDPWTKLPNSASAAMHGFVGGDILQTPVPAGPVLVWAPAPLLGLDFFGPDTDDLDALAIWENGTGLFEPSQTPNDWLGGNTDMVLFSVRRGSALIGAPDSIFGIPIEEGDILTTPLPIPLGGLSPFPGMYIAAENLGLVTVRSGAANFGDELDALDVLTMPLFDCDGNGLEDAIDIAMGTHPDGNNNGIPDPCETGILPSCFCPPGISPCGNGDPGAGCANSTGLGAVLSAAGTTSVGLDNLVLTSGQMPTNVNGILFMGSAAIPPLPFGDGLRCSGASVFRYGLGNSGAGGSMSHGPGLVAYGLANFLPPGHVTAGSTWSFQAWYRDPPGPCLTGYNLSSSLWVTFTP